jgi:putative PEP-CTERM system TPR-repeat lipoprotein
MIAKEPTNEQLYLALAELQARSGAPPKEIATTLQRAVQADPQAPAARLALINFQRQAGDNKAALSAAQEALAAMPADARVLDAAGLAQEAAGEVNQAIGTYNKLAALQPEAPQPLYRLAALYLRQKDTDKAVESLRRAQKVAPRERDVMPQIVQLYLAAGRPDDAFREARDLQKREPKSARGWALEGDVYLSQRKFAEAERCYRDALKMEPNANAVAARLHAALTASGKVGEAEAWARKWIAEHPKDAAMHVYLGEREREAKRLKAAYTHYLAAVAIQPGNALTLNNLAGIAGELGDPKALGYAERAVKLAPNDAAVLDTYGMLLVGQGNFDKAMPVLERARQLAPARNDLRLNYAKALIKAGRKDAARSELETLAKVSEKFAGKDEVAGLLKGL